MRTVYWRVHATHAHFYMINFWTAETPTMLTRKVDVLDDKHLRKAIAGHLQMDFQLVEASRDLR